MAKKSHTHAYRIVFGAIRNTIHHHPEWKAGIPESFARSVSKRAAGTLQAHFAEWSGRLAARRSVKRSKRIKPL